MKWPGVEIERFLVLAPMDDITDQAVRVIARRLGADLVVTEFVSAEGLRHGATKSLRKMRLCEEEHPVSIQIFGSRIDSIIEAALMAERAAPDSVDLNFGCPAKKVAGKGSGVALMKDPDKLEAMARAVVEAVSIPVTAKVRLGWDLDSINVLDVCRRLEGCGIAGVAVHGRTRSQSYGVRADWSWIKRVKDSVSIPVIGNGDIRTPEDAERMFEETGCDGVMIGHGAVGNPWVFREIRHYLNTGETLPAAPLVDRMDLLIEHIKCSIADKGERRAVIEIRKHYKGYLKGTRGASKVRTELMETVTLDEVVAVLDRYREEYLSGDFG
jgi:tRNA-dihydrouridine synthase B